MIVYISIGNSDDKLSQQEWAQFHSNVEGAIDANVAMVHGRWTSDPTDPWQNACWCVELLNSDHTAKLRGRLAGEAKAFRQDSIAWAEAPTTEFLTPA